MNGMGIFKTSSSPLSSPMQSQIQSQQTAMQTAASHAIPSVNSSPADLQGNNHCGFDKHLEFEPQLKRLMDNEAYLSTLGSLDCENVENLTLRFFASGMSQESGEGGSGGRAIKRERDAAKSLTAFYPDLLEKSFIEIQSSKYIGSIGNVIEQKMLIYNCIINTMVRALAPNKGNWHTTILDGKDSDSWANHLSQHRKNFYRQKGILERKRISDKNSASLMNTGNQSIKDSLLEIEWNYCQALWHLLITAIDSLDRMNLSLQNIQTFVSSRLGKNKLTLNSHEKKGLIDKTFSPFSADVSLYLTNFYHQNQYPSKQEKRDLASQTDLKISQVNSWFSNRRTRYRKTARKARQCIE